MNQAGALVMVYRDGSVLISHGKANDIHIKSIIVYEQLILNYLVKSIITDIS